MLCQETKTKKLQLRKTAHEKKMLNYQNLNGQNRSGKFFVIKDIDSWCLQMFWTSLLALFTVFTETALSRTGKCVSWTVGLISRYAMVYIHGNAPRQALSLGLGNQRTRKSTDSEINGLENQRTRESTDSGINGPGNQRTRKSTDSEINGLGNQQTRKSTDSEINGLGNQRARQKLA